MCLKVISRRPDIRIDTQTILLKDRQIPETQLTPRLLMNRRGVFFFFAAMKHRSSLSI